MTDICGLYLAPPANAEQNPRFVVHFPSTYASWMNLVEAWFGIIERQAIRRGLFKSVKDLNAKLRAFIDGGHDRAHPSCGPRPSTRSSPTPTTPTTSNPHHQLTPELPQYHASSYFDIVNFGSFIQDLSPMYFTILGNSLTSQTRRIYFQIPYHIPSEAVRRALKCWRYTSLLGVHGSAQE